MPSQTQRPNDSVQRWGWDALSVDHAQSPTPTEESTPGVVGLASDRRERRNARRQAKPILPPTGRSQAGLSRDCGRNGAGWMRLGFFPPAGRQGSMPEAAIKGLVQPPTKALSSKTSRNTSVKTTGGAVLGLWKRA
ncbi:MAG: hypothetical protein M3Q45_03005 [Chloroflexota bacterium]|nr:hypothetical protein [Chloroflexota bacterium]